MKAILIAIISLSLCAPAFAKGGRGGGHRGGHSYSKSVGGQKSVKKTYRGRGGCGSRGGPGYRKANGQCASWKD